MDTSQNVHKWEFTLDNKKICIILTINIENNEKKIIYNNETILEKRNAHEIDKFDFFRDGHNYKIIQKFDNFDLFIDEIKYEKNLFKDKEKFNLIKEGIRVQSNLFKDKKNIYPIMVNAIKIKVKENKADNDIICLRECNIKESCSKNYHRNSRFSESSSFINIKFFNIENQIQYPKEELSGLLNLCLLKYISEFFDNDSIKQLSIEIRQIILKLRKNINFTGDNKKNIQLLLKENSGNNILIYSQYLNMIINQNKINNLIGLLNNPNKTKINIYWGCLSKYVEYNKFFEEEFTKDLKNTKFDYSLISLGILERNDEYEYKSKRDTCPNMKKRILYHGSQIDPISCILTDEFKYTKKAFYGMGIYFSDIIDYIAFYCGGSNFNNRRDNFGKIIPVNSTFSFIASEVFFDQTKFKQIIDDSLYVPDFNFFPSYEYIKRNYPDKMIKPNGIHFIRVDNEGDPLKEKDYINLKKEGLFFGNEYAITEKYQIFPIYSLTVKRNEYFIIWRDPNFAGENQWSEYLLERKLFCTEKANMNIYFENSTEEALRFLLRRKYNKVIIITSIGLDLSGKRFIEIARKILNFDVMVLFFSANEKHLKWIQEFPNCLYTDTSEIYEDYILNFNETGLKNLKKTVEKEYNISLMEFSKDFLSYPNFKNEAEFSSLNFSSYNPYFRRVKIYRKNKKLLICPGMKNNVKNNIWEITIFNDEITLFFNGYYLYANEDKENASYSKFMKIWKFKKVNNYYYFIFPEKEKENILSVENNTIKINKEKPGDNELFELIDEIEE